MALNVDKLKLPCISREGQRILVRIAEEGVDLGEVAELAAQDAAVSATLIKYANAPLYRRAMEVRNVRNAVSLLGITNVRLAVVVVTFRAFSHPPDENKELIWEHAFGTSILAHMIAGRVCRRSADDVALTAMMHDLGALVLAGNFPDEYRAILDESRERGVPVEPLEREAFGISHLELMGQLAERLRLPQSTRKVLHGYHAQALSAIRSPIERHIAIIALANFLERESYSPRGHFIKEVPASRESLQLALGLGDDELSDLVESFETDMNEHYGSL